jgi:hypothetical protein
MQMHVAFADGKIGMAMPNYARPVDVAAVEKSRASTLDIRQANPSDLVPSRGATPAGTVLS